MPNLKRLRNASIAEALEILQSEEPLNNMAFRTALINAFGYIGKFDRDRQQLLEIFQWFNQSQWFNQRMDEAKLAEMPSASSRES